ncbi:hypothetical protein [Enemella sp. A6]|uniref:hypothetical protein n=1 Tax=Enemella sp. A6 TaxID=3440152 RepID=UPI003EBF85FB
MPDPQFREQYRPIDPEQAADLAAQQPSLFAIEVANADACRYGLRLVNLITGEEVARHADDVEPGTEELVAVAMGIAAALDIDPRARFVVRGSADLVHRLRVEELDDDAAVAEVAREAQP